MPDASSPTHAAYWCFISYRHADNQQPGRQWATWLHQQIETYEVPSELIGTKNDLGETIPERIFPVFRDEEELPADADLATPIYRALDRSKFLVVLCSPRAAQSAYVHDEVRYFKQSGKASRVLAVLIEGEPNASWDTAKQTQLGIDPASECFPKALRHPVGPDGKLIESEHAEPIAADFRLPGRAQGWTTPEAYRLALREQQPGSDDAAIEKSVAAYRQRCELAKLKIIAGCLGIPLGQLTRRDKAYQLEKARRRARILWQVSAAMGALAAIAVTAGIFAFSREKDARREKAKSDDLNEYMLGSLYDRLVPIGRVDLLDEAAGRLQKNLATGSHSAEPADRLRDLRLQDRVARIRLAQGRLSEAYEIARTTPAVVPSDLRARDPEIAIACAGLESLAGDLGIRLGRNEEGEAFANRAVAEFRARLADPRVPALLAQALSNRMDYATQSLQFQTAADLGAEAFDLSRKAATQQPFPEAFETLLRIELRLSRLAADRGESARAAEILERRNSELLEAAAKFPEHWLWSREKIVNAIEQSRLLLGQDNLDRAEELAQGALNEALTLETRDPSNLEWRRIAATAFNHLATVELAGGNASSALDKYREGLGRFQTLVDFSPHNLGWRSALAWTHDGLREALVAGDQAAEAVKESAAAVDLLRTVHQELGRPASGEATRELMLALTHRANAMLDDQADPELIAKVAAEAVDLARASTRQGGASATDANACAAVFLLQANLLSARSATADAVNFAAEAVACLTAARREGEPVSQTLRFASAQLRLASLQGEDSQTAAARDSIAGCIALLSSLPASDPGTATLLEKARALQQSLK